MSDPLFARPFVNRLGIRPVKPTIRCIIEQTCTKYRVRVDDLLGDGRTAELAKARQEIYFRSHIELRKTTGEIGRVMGRHPSTVCHGIERYRSWGAA